MIKKISFLLVLFLICGSSCTSVAAIEPVESVPVESVNDSFKEIEPIPDVLTLHHFLSSQVVKDWMKQTEREVNELDTFLDQKRRCNELAVVRLQDGKIIYQCNNGQYSDDDNRTGYLRCDPFLYSNETWAIYPVNTKFFDEVTIDHNVNETMLKNYWKMEIDQFWNDSKQFLAGTIFDGKIIDHSAADESWENKNYYNSYTCPGFKDANGNRWKFSINLHYRGKPNKIDEGCFYYNLGTSSYSICVDVIHKGDMPINHDDFVLGPIVYHY